MNALGFSATEAAQNYYNLFRNELDHDIIHKELEITEEFIYQERRRLPSNLELQGPCGRSGCCQRAQLWDTGFKRAAREFASGNRTSQLQSANAPSELFGCQFVSLC